MRVKIVTGSKAFNSPCCDIPMALAGYRLGNPDDQSDPGTGYWLCPKCRKEWWDDIHLLGEDSFLSSEPPF